MPPEVEAGLFRFVQGAIGNIAQHSKAKNVTIVLEYQTDELLLRIRDDLERQIGKVEEFKVRIESEILASFNEKVTIQLEVSLEPLVEMCTID